MYSATAPQSIMVEASGTFRRGTIAVDILGYCSFSHTYTSARATSCQVPRQVFTVFVPTPSTFSTMLSFIVLGGVVLSYALLVRTLRYRRIEQIQKQHGATPLQFQGLNYKDAQAILGQLGLFECPWMFLSGKDFAFLRVGLQAPPDPVDTGPHSEQSPAH